MKERRVQNVFFIILLVLVALLALFILRPFISAIFFGVILAIVFKSTHHRILKICRENSYLASFISTVLILGLILLPLALLSILFFGEVKSAYIKIIENSGQLPAVDSIVEYLKARFHTSVPLIDFDMERYLRQGMTFFVDNIDSFFSSFFKIFTDFIIMGFTLFYTLKDGKKLREKLVYISPLPDVYDRQIFRKIEISINSVVKGFLAVAVIQGLLSALGFYLFQVPLPILWGTVSAVAALVPIVGTALVTVPAVFYLFFVKGSLTLAIGMSAWALVIINIADNIVSPLIINRGVKIHPFLILISILGGIAFFGPIGFIAGPVILSILVALIEIYPVIMGRMPEEKIK